ncbi:hypothetical protein GCM10027262_11810 [Nocardia tengchongensis]
MVLIGVKTFQSITGWPGPVLVRGVGMLCRECAHTAAGMRPNQPRLSGIALTTSRIRNHGRRTTFTARVGFKVVVRIASL